MAGQISAVGEDRDDHPEGGKKSISQRKCSVFQANMTSLSMLACYPRLCLLNLFNFFQLFLMNRIYGLKRVASTIMDISYRIVGQDRVKVAIITVAPTGQQLHS